MPNFQRIVWKDVLATYPYHLQMEELQSKLFQIASVAQNSNITTYCNLLGEHSKGKSLIMLV